MTLIEANIRVDIEACRKRMIELSKLYPLTSNEVVSVSVELDKLLNKLDRTKSSF